MTAPEADFEDIDQQITAITERAGDLMRKDWDRSAYRVYGEKRRLARTHRRVIPYIYGTFHQIHLSSTMLEPRTAQEHAIELLSLLESEDRARQFQTDFDQEEYDHAVGWMTACVYELLSDATGDAEGFNSEGMHTCLSDGIQVCRRTGKMGCIRCFHSFAVDVYRSSDDMPMALHYARSMQAERDQYMDRGDDRHKGAIKESWILLLQGRLQAAIETVQRAREMLKSPQVLNPYSSLLTTIGPQERHCSILLGQTEEVRLPTLTGEEKMYGVETRPLPRDESRFFDLQWDLADAVLACRNGDFKKAQEVLMGWDRWLTEHHGSHYWFEVRLRLIATHRLAGTEDRIEPLAKQLDERAWKARDWLTLHRLARLMDRSVAATPLALLGPVDVGPFAAVGATVTVPAAPADEEPSQTEAPPEEPPVETPPLETTFQQLADRLNALDSDEARSALLDDVLALPPSAVTHPLDAARLLHLLQYVIAPDDSIATQVGVWTWAEAIAEPFPQVAIVLNLLAALGDQLRDMTPDLTERITTERIEKLFRASVDLDPFHSRNHFRAGVYYLSQDSLGEAERCLARGFRLERNFGALALRLAEVYDRTERPGDALMVLDTCLREGCKELGVAWQAAVSALHLKQYEAMLTYLDHHEQLQPGEPWANYYRAIGQLELGKPQEALTALDEEARRAPNHTLSRHILAACGEQMLGRTEEARQHLTRVLDVRLSEVDYLTFSGMCNLFARLWTTLGVALPAEDPLRERLEQILLTTGLAPDDLFEMYREGAEVQDDVHFYRVQVRQPLDEGWATSESCLPGQQEWTYYFALWGALARDAEEAWRLVQDRQARCGSLPAELLECEPEGEYKDKPGVVWQGQRWCEEESGEE